MDGGLIRHAACRTGALAALLLLSGVLAGCASYATPGRAADFVALGITRDQLTDSTVAQTLARQPLAAFPCSIATVRIQAPGYRSETAEGWGTGKYSIVTTRDVEKDDQFDRLSKMELVSGLAPVNRLLLPEKLESDVQLREAAAALHADMLLIYTIDTTFNVNDKATPLTVLTLGLSPNQIVHVVSTSSAVLLDTRNGFVYGFAEATDKADQLTSDWTKSSAIDDARRNAESRSFGKLVDQVAQSWSNVVRTYARKPATAPTQQVGSSDLMPLVP